MSQIKAAHFEHGSVFLMTAAPVGIAGSKIAASSAGSTGADIELTFPRDSVSRPVTVSLAYDDGTLAGASGQPASGAIVVSADGLQDFMAPVSIRVQYPVDLKPKAIAGYAIDEAGSLAVLDLVGIDAASSTVTFSTFRPVTFTWTYLY